MLNVRYLQDAAGQDTYPTLRGTLEAGGEDCDGFTIGMCALAGAVGYSSVASIISVHGKSWDHVYPVVKTRKGWVAMDATEKGKKIGWEYMNGRPPARQNFWMVE